MLDIDIATAAGPGILRVTRLEWREALDQPFELLLDLVSAADDLDAALMMGSNLTVCLRVPGAAEPRFINGHVSSWRRLGAVRRSGGLAEGACRYQATVGPALCFLKGHLRHRAFRDQPLGEVLRQVLCEEPRLQLDRRYAQTSVQPWLVQYGETDFDFCHRLAQRLGIRYAFRHEDGGHQMVMSDTPAPLFPEVARARLAAGSERDLRDADLLFECVDHAWQRPHAVLLGSGVPGRPQQPMFSGTPLPRPREDPGGTGSGRLHLHPVSAVDPADLEAQSARRAQALAVSGRRIVAQGRHLGLQVGGWMDLDTGGRIRRHLVCAQRWSLQPGGTSDPSCDAADPQIRTEVELLPAVLPWQPSMSVAWPRVAGVQAARVVADGRAGEADARPGCVRVVFPWDPASQTTPPLPVLQPDAGRGRGWQGWPRIGDTVLVQCIDGDPDQPVVLGSLRDVDTWLPWPGRTGRRRWGWRSRSLDARGREVEGRFQEWRVDDRAGEEQIFLRAQRDLAERVLRHHHRRIGGQQHQRVAGDLHDQCDADRHLRTAGDLRQRVEGSVSLRAGQDVVSEVLGKTWSLGCAGDISMSAEGRLVLDARQGISLRCGPHRIDIDAAGIRITGPRLPGGGPSLPLLPARAWPVREAAVPDDDADPSSPVGPLPGDVPGVSGAELVPFALGARDAGDGGQALVEPCDCPPPKREAVR